MEDLFEILTATGYEEVGEASSEEASRRVNNLIKRKQEAILKLESAVTPLPRSADYEAIISDLMDVLSTDINPLGIKLKTLRILQSDIIPNIAPTNIDLLKKVLKQLYEAIEDAVDPKAELANAAIDVLYTVCNRSPDPRLIKRSLGIAVTIACARTHSGARTKALNFIEYVKNNFTDLFDEHINHMLQDLEAPSSEVFNIVDDSFISAAAIAQLFALIHNKVSPDHLHKMVTIFLRALRSQEQPLATAIANQCLETLQEHGFIGHDDLMRAILKVDEEFSENSQQQSPKISPTHKPTQYLPRQSIWGEQNRKASTSKQEYLDGVKDPAYFQQLAAPDGFYSNKNLFAFANPPGPLKIGVCWWHSRFQRNALYLTTYRPNLPRPTARQALIIIKDIRAGRKVIEIPGFNNFNEFSVAYQNQITRELGNWQLLDGFLFFSWINSMIGKHVTTPADLERKMTKIYAEVHDKHRISYAKLPQRGVGSHSFLVSEMRKNADAHGNFSGYSMKIIDSNNADSVVLFDYQKGQTSLTNMIFPLWTVPYLQRTKDAKNYEKAIEKYARSPKARL